MDNSKEHIDHLLAEVMTDAQMSADGIDWSAFQSKRRRKLVLWWVTAGVAALIISTAAFFAFGPNNSTELVESVTTNNSTNPKGILENNKEAEIETAVTRDSSTANVMSQGETNSVVTPNIIVNPANTGAKSGKHVRTTKRIVDGKDMKRPEVKWEFEIFKLQPKGYPRFTITPYPHNAPESIIVDLIKVDLGEPEVSTSFVKLGFGPTLVNPNLSLNTSGESLIHKDYISIRNAAEKNAVGFYMSGMIGKKFNRLSPYIGLGLCHNAVFASYNFEYTEKPIQDLNGTILGYQKRATERVAFKSDQSYSLLDIPVGAEFSLKSNSKKAWNLVGQVSPQILVSAQGDLPNAVLLNQKDLITTSNYKLNSITAQIGFNYASQLKGMQWYIEPKLAHNFGLNQVKDLYNTRFNMIVVTFGIKK